MDVVQKTIAKNLLKIRKEKGLSLEKTAELTGVSKAMLGQIERNESNPTVSTLWKIAKGLKISFSSLMKEEEQSVTVVNAQNQHPVVDENGAYKVYSVFPFEPGKQFEMYTVTIDSLYIHKAEAHMKGVEEYIVVESGELVLSVNDVEYRLSKGQAVRFRADVPHAYENKSDSMVKLTVMIYYPEL